MSGKRPGATLKTSVYNAILSDLDRREQLRRELKEYSYRAIAKRRGVAKNTVWSINASIRGVE